MNEDEKIIGLIREREILSGVLLQLVGTTETGLYRDFARRYLEVQKLIHAPLDE